MKRPISCGFTPASNSARSKRRAPGSVVAVTGLSHSYVGLGLGAEAEASAPLLQPVLTYQLILPDGADAHSALIKLRELEEEDPMLRIVWGERYGRSTYSSWAKFSSKFCAAASSTASAST